MLIQFNTVHVNKVDAMNTINRILISYDRFRKSFASKILQAIYSSPSNFMLSLTYLPDMTVLALLSNLLSDCLYYPSL